MKKVILGALFGGGLLLALLAVGCAGQQGPSTADVEKLVNDKFSTVDRKLPLWDIQPGTAARMRELTESFNLMWFAAQEGNWDFAGFEVYRAGEEAKAIPVTRPSREAMVKGWSEPNLKALSDAVKAKDKAAFETAYDNAIAGCNACHSVSEGGGFSLKSVKVTRPTAPLYSNIDFAGQ